MKCERYISFTKFTVQAAKKSQVQLDIMTAVSSQLWNSDNDDDDDNDVC